MHEAGTLDELTALAGAEPGTSAWHTVDPTRIDAFAAVTWITVHPRRPGRGRGDPARDDGRARFPVPVAGHRIQPGGRPCGTWGPGEPQLRDQAALRFAGAQRLAHPWAVRVQSIDAQDSGRTQCAV